MVTDKKWVIQRVDESKKTILQDTLHVHASIAELLIKRGVGTPDEAQLHLRPNLHQLHDPMLMKDMDLAVQRIQKALVGNEKMLVYGDYDVDGTTAVALVYSFLSNLYYDIDFYIPDRNKEGCGISYEGIDYAHEHGISLIIALDCGIRSVEHVEYAKTLGIDFIICDHHLPGEELPDADAILFPRQPGCEYPYKFLSGNGIGFKLCQALCVELDIPIRDLFCYLDLAAISIACDLVPITGENRILAYYGLKKLNERPLPGLKALMEICGLEGEVTISDINFALGPRINAAGRIENGKDAVNLLISGEKHISLDRAKVLQGMNLERQKLDRLATQEAKEIIEDAYDENSPVIIVYNEEWHKGVIGIVASRIIEQYRKPTLVLTKSEEDNIITGSARSINGIDIHEAIERCEDQLMQFGGHKYAAGLSVEADKLNDFIRMFKSEIGLQHSVKHVEDNLEIDCIINISEITKRLFFRVKSLGPFGPKNPIPIFCAINIQAQESAKVVGSNHLKIDFINVENRRVNAIGFHMGQYLDVVSKQRFDMCFTLEDNEFRGNKSFQIRIREIRPTGSYEGILEAV